MFFSAVRLISILLLMIMFFPVNSNPIFSLQKGYYDIALGGGIVNVGETQTLTLLPPFTNAYHPESKSQGLFLGELFFAYPMAFYRDSQLLLGLSLAMSNQFQSQGIVDQSLVPGFDNLDYEFQIQHQHIAFEARWLTPLKSWLKPYLLVSVGAAQNKASDYQETPRLFPAVAPPPFTDKTTNSFTYALGIGVQLPLFHHINTGIAYTFSDLGKVELGVSPAQATQETLHFPHLYTNLVSLHINYAT